jgi:hypothetical protein
MGKRYIEICSKYLYGHTCAFDIPRFKKIEKLIIYSSFKIPSKIILKIVKNNTNFKTNSYIEI